MVTIRQARYEDTGELRHLWKDVFGDSDAFLDRYFDRYFDPAQMLLAAGGDRILSMSSLYRHSALIAGGADAGECPCVFAVATAPDARGQHLAMTLIHRQLEAEARRGTPCVMVAPAQESLFGLYGKTFGFVPYFSVTKLICRPAGGCCGPVGAPQAEQITPAEYGARREELLQGLNHLRFMPEQLMLEADLCAMSGGGLYAFPGGIFAAERMYDTRVRVNELLVHEQDLCPAIQILQGLLPAEEYEIRMTPYVNRFEAVQSLRVYPGTYEWCSPAPFAMLLPFSFRAPDGGGEGAYAGFVFD